MDRNQHKIKKMIREYVKSLSKEIRVQKVILFGSWATGNYLEDSDVDLIVLSNEFTGVHLEDRLAILQRHWDDVRYGRALEAFGYTELEFRELQTCHHIVREARRKGLIVT